MAMDSGKATAQILGPSPAQILGPSPAQILGPSPALPIANRQLRFWWILGGSFVCQCLVLQSFNWWPGLHEMMSPDSNLGTLLHSLLWGTMASVFAIIAFCAVWGSANLQLRLLLTVGFALAFAIVSPFNSHQSAPRWTIIILFQLLLGCYIMLMFLTAWLTKLSLQDKLETHALRKAGQTFSLKYMGAWGITVAVLLTISRALIGNQTFDDLFPDHAMAMQLIVIFSVLFSVNFLLASPLILSILSNGYWWLRVLGCVFAVVPITLLESYIINQIPEVVGPFTLLLGMNLVQLLWVLLTFGLLRRTGFRLADAQARP